MAFVQIVDCKTSRIDDMNRLMDAWVTQTQGKRTATHAIVGTDRADNAHVVEIVEFPSYEEAERNSHLPETDRIFHEMVALCDEPPVFTDLDVVRDEQLNKAAVTRLFEQISAGNLDAILDLCAADYHDHDQANAIDTVGAEGFRRECAGYRAGFPDFAFTIETQLAEGDQVATRWTWRATNTGEYNGMPATGRAVEAAGTTTFRMADGKIAEGWWNWDNLGVMRQLGIIDI